MEEIRETTVGRLDGVDVGIGNIWDRTYDLPDGATRTGPSAEVFVLVADQNPAVVVGAGSVITVGGSRWRVVEVRASATGRGSVAFERLGPASE